MRVIFMGTPQFAVPCLESLINSRHTVVGVVCQPDRKGNRNKIVKPPVKVLAEKHNIDVYQFERVSRDGIDKLRVLNADIMITVAFGQILSDDVLKLTPNGVINVHASLLPSYRGSAPIHYAIINGEKTTGITIMQTAKEIDSGNIIMQESIQIKEDETTGELTERLSLLGADLLIRALDAIENNESKSIPQDHTKATYFPMLKKSDGEINWNKTSKEIVDFVRGMQPWPTAYTFINDKMIKVLKANNINYSGGDKSGEVVEINPKVGLIVKVKDGYIRLIEVQPEGKRVMCDSDYLLGSPIKKGTIL